MPRFLLQGSRYHSRVSCAPPHPAALDEDDLLKQCTVRRARGSGPGGQHRNKVETHITLRHEPSGNTAEAGERRSQRENKQVALFRLRMKLAIELRQAVSSPHEPSVLWRSRCHKGRIAVNPKHEDFPAMLAEAMDVIAACDYDLRPAADQLACSATQLVKLLKVEPRALMCINTERQQRELHALR